MPRDTTSSLQ